MQKQPAVYILASKRNGTLYIGVTSNLIQRVWQHKENHIEGFTKRYGIHLLVYYELHQTMPDAISREKQMKAWKRQWKINLIEQNFLEMANRENIKNISFMHILAYDAGKMVGIHIGEKYNREEFCARMNSSKFKGFAAQETYFTDNIAQRKYQIIKKKDNQFRVLLVK